MGDFQACVWRSAILFVAATRDQFSETVVLIDRHRSSDVILSLPKRTIQTVDNNYSGYLLVAVLLTLFGIEQIFLYVRLRKAHRTSGESCLVYEDVKSIQEERVVEEIITATPEDLEEVPVNVSTLLELARDGLVKYSPQRADDGTSGVYFIKDTNGNKCAVFKPADEEAMDLEGLSGEEVKPGCLIGEGYLKEVAASLIDKEGFHGVPTTTLAQFAHDEFSNNGVPAEKLGSLQEFVSSKCTAEDMGASKFSTRDVHKIGLLDCRILNLDRHLGNMLVTNIEGSHRLVPIDHALSFPSSITGGSFEWLSFPQCKQPFDEETVNYICKIDVDADVQMLRRRLPNMKEECIETMKICTIFLKKAVAKGFNLYQIGCMMSRYLDEEQATDLERMYIRVQERSASGGAPFWSVVDEEIDAVLASK